MITTIVGILHLSSDKVYSSKKSNMIYKSMTPFMKNLPKVLVKTKRLKLEPDIYVVAKLEHISNNIFYCSVLEYVDNDKILDALSTSHWNKKINKINLDITDLTPDRLNLTHLSIYSIDPVGCEDIDDALHCIKLDDQYEIGIHIADVSSYIEENSAYDIELSKRIESIYLKDKRIDMISSYLSIEHMSLKEGKIKRAFSVIFNFDGIKISNIRFHKSFITVTKNMTYDDPEIEKSLLFEIGIKLKNLINFDENEKYDSHQMVAIYMILCNQIVAETISNYDPKNCILRSHDEKTIEKALCSDPILVKKYELSLLESANYTIGIDNSWHSKLKLYTHFTSPIRRYCDILIHRQLWNTINKKEFAVKDMSLINIYSKYYKQVERYSNLLNKLEDIDLLECYAYIVGIRDNNVRLYISELDLDYDVSVINNTLEHIKIENTSSKLIMTNIGSNLELNLFQKIKIMIYKSQKFRLDISIISPNIKEFLIN